MNIHDLCHEGRKFYAEFEIYAEAFRVHKRIQSWAMMHKTHREFLDHLEECELCGGKDE